MTKPAQYKFIALHKKYKKSLERYRAANAAVEQAHKEYYAVHQRIMPDTAQCKEMRRLFRLKDKQWEESLRSMFDIPEHIWRSARDDAHLVEILEAMAA